MIENNNIKADTLEESDEELIEVFQSTGDKAILANLLKNYRQKLFGLSYYYLHNQDDAMDAVMETYVIVLSTIDGRVITNFKSWMMSICRNVCCNMLRKRSQVRNITKDLALFMERETEPHYADEDIEYLLQLMDSLKEQQRRCVEDFYLKKMSYSQIADKTGYSLKEVKSYIQNGKRNLKIMFEKNSKLN